MRRPAPATVAAFLAIIAAFAVIVAVLGFATDGASAVRVGDARVSERSVNEELAAIADRGGDGLRRTDGSIDAATSAGVTSDVVRALLSASILGRRDQGITGPDRAVARDILEGGAFDGLPRWFRDRYADRIANVAALARVLGVDFEAPEAQPTLTAAWRREARRVGVTVDPAYGRWVGRIAQVVPYSVTPDQIAQARGSG
jgi:hypothetical protein